MRLRTHCRRARRTAASAAVLLLAFLAVPVHAGAATVFHGAAQGSEHVTSAVWSATASPSSLTLYDSDATSTVTNTGTVALTGVSYQVTVSDTFLAFTSYQLEVCTAPWNGTTCPGTETAVGGTFDLGTTTVVDSSVVPAVGASVYLLAVQNGFTLLPVTVTVQALVSSATQLRPPVHTFR